MKRILVIGLLLSTLIGSAQNPRQLRQLADEYFAIKQFKAASEFYDRLHILDPDDDEVCLLYVESLMGALLYDEAEKELEKLIERGSHSNEILYNFGFLLKTQQKYLRADSVLARILGEMDQSDPYYGRAKLQREGCLLALRQKRFKDRYAITALDAVNSKENDYGAVENPVTKEIILMTQRNTGQKQYPDEQFGGLLPNTIGYSKNGESYRRNNKYAVLNSRWGDGSGTFSRNGQFYYFSSCKRNCEIFYSRWNGSEWSDPKPLDEPINLKDTDSKQPNLSVTGDTLFFTSNREGTIGGDDIWMSIRLDSVTWSPPVNMGENINTTENEMSPHYSSAFGALLFSSNGHAGYGGYDIYMAKGKSFYSPEVYHIGTPFNSPRDDNYFSLGDKIGLLSSDREQEDFNIYNFPFEDEIRLLRSFMGNDALVNLVAFRTASLDLETLRLEDFQDFHIFRPVEEVKEVVIRKSTKHKRIAGKALPNMRATLNISEKITITSLTDENGRFEFALLPDTIKANWKVYVGSSEIDSRAVDTTYNYYRYEFEKIYFNTGSSTIRREAQETLRDLMSQFDPENIILVDINTHADNVGSREFNFELSARRGISVIRFLQDMGLPIGKTRVFAYGEDKLLSANDTWYSRLYNRRAELIVYTKRPVTFFTPNVFVARQDISLKRAAESMAVDMDQLKTWNGFDGRTVIQGSVLRVFDPEHLTPNIRYFIPENDLNKTFITLRIRRGETLSDLASRYGLPEELLLEINHLYEHPRPGQEITIMQDPNALLKE